MRPTVATLHAPICAVAAMADGYAALTTAGIVLLDGALIERGRIEGDHTEPNLVEVASQRFALHADQWSALWIGGPQAPIAQIDLGKDWVSSLVPTPSGFLAVLHHSVLVDVGGTRTHVKLDKLIDHGGCAWNGGAIVAGRGGFAILDAHGEVKARSPQFFASQRPVALPALGWFAVPESDGTSLFDGEARLVGRLPIGISSGHLRPYATGLLVRDDEALTLSYYELAQGEPTRAWQLTSAQLMQAPVVVGDWVVAPTYEQSVTILDRSGAILARLDVGGVPSDVAALGDGLAIRGRDARAVTWWRPGGELTQLAHDVTAQGIVAVPAGLVTFEGNQLLLWRPDVDGPERALLDCEYPLDRPIVVNGQILRVEGAGHARIRAVTETRERFTPRALAIEPGTPWREVTPRAEAERIATQLAQRELTEPPISLTELAFAMGTSQRALLGALRVRKIRLVPPRPIPGYDYLGSFITSGKLSISDPCYVGKSDNAWLSLKVEALEGLWHVFVGPGTSELAAIHDTGFELYASESVANLGVDSGTMGIYDKAFPKASLASESHSHDDQVLHGLGVIASTGGDGTFPVFVARRGVPVAKIRVVFQSERPEIDQLIAKTAGATTKKYAASATFVVGDTIEHVKFGTGHVTRVGGDKKIDVRFGDAMRTLVHAKS